MSGFFNKYPYTDFHELNLDWLLTTYQKIVDDIESLNLWRSTHIEEYQAAMIRLTAVENEINTFEQQIEAQFDTLSRDIAAQMEQQRAEIAAYLQRTEQEINRMIVEFQNEMARIKAALIQEMNDLRAQVLRLMADIQSTLQANDEFIFEWVNRRLQEFIDSLPEILTVMVYNPYRGEVTDIQVALNDIYSLVCIWGLTARQYDTLQLTAQEYDNLYLTAQEYDTLGYRLLYKDPYYYMIDPFTGDNVLIKTVVWKLADLHKNALTASAYDALALDADTYDLKGLEAYDYDWNGAALLP